MNKKFSNFPSPSPPKNSGCVFKSCFHSHSPSWVHLSLFCIWNFPIWTFQESSFHQTTFPFTFFFSVSFFLAPPLFVLPSCVYFCCCFFLVSSFFFIFGEGFCAISYAKQWQMFASAQNDTTLLWNEERRKGK